ncbi:MAG: RHS repeat-associated core domain-containing protein, partial [Pirellulales bacterium]|nr:RHS repeat-associated core domain-containing protein [Pirellulales bacterium]
RYSYTPYGETVIYDASFNVRNSSSYDWVYLYTGRRLDEETGLYYYRNRYYHAALGRFCSRDPIGYEGSKWGLYEMVESSPLTLLDPQGLGPIGWICKKIFKSRKTTKVTKLTRTVKMPKTPDTPPGYELVGSELIGETATFTYKHRQTGKIMTLTRKAIIVGTATTCFLVVTKFAYECTIVSDIEDGCRLWTGDHEKLVEYGLREEVLDCSVDIAPGGPKPL